MAWPGRHGSMASSEFVSLIERNAEFLAVRRSGRGDGICGLYKAVSGEYVCGIGGGVLPAYTFYRNEVPQCVRGWRNILWDLVRSRHVRASKEIKKVLGTDDTNSALDGKAILAPHRPADDAHRYADEARRSDHIRGVHGA